MTATFKRAEDKARDTVATRRDGRGHGEDELHRNLTHSHHRRSGLDPTGGSRVRLAADAADSDVGVATVLTTGSSGGGGMPMS